MPKFVARLVGVFPSLVDGMYLQSFDPEASNGRGDIKCSPLLANAMRFNSKAEALTLWSTVPKFHPVRESDGMPNKPLTAFHMSIEAIEEEGKCTN